MKNDKIVIVIIALCLFSIIAGLYGKNQNDQKTQLIKDENGIKLFSDRAKIALINIDGPIQFENGDTPFAPKSSAESARISLQKALKDNNIKGILLRINSPGGTVGMSQEVYADVLKARQQKPVVVSMGDMAASGGYYIASAADRIYAYPGTLTGSIGVILSTYDAGEFLTKKLGIKPQTIKSGKFKDIASPYRTMTKEERQLLQNMTDSTHQQFISAIIDARSKRNDNYKEKKEVLKSDILRKYADGRIFNGEQAIKIGLVDNLGTLDDAYKAISNMAKEKFNISTSTEIPLVPYNTQSGLSELLYGTKSQIEKLGIKNDLNSKLMPYSIQHPNQPLLIWE